MAKSRKKSLSQQAVGVATMGMPAPARKILSSRIGALLVVIVIPVLFATGIISVQWENGRPKVSFNRERAVEVEQKAAQRIEAIKEERDGDRPALADYVPHFGERKEEPTGFATDIQRDVQGFEHRVAERYDEVKDNVVGDNQQGWQIGPVGGQPDSQGKQPFQPFQGVRDKLEDLRR
jgi:hypothetical protein